MQETALGAMLSKAKAPLPRLALLWPFRLKNPQFGNHAKLIMLCHFLRFQPILETYRIPFSSRTARVFIAFSL